MGKSANAKWYFEGDPESNLREKIFFDAIKKFGVDWYNATDSERAFINEFCRYTYDRTVAINNGTDIGLVRGFFENSAGYTERINSKNNIMHYKGYIGSVEFSETDKVFYGKVQGIRSLLSYEGHDVEELAEDFRDVVDEYLEDCKADGIEPEKA